MFLPSPESEKKKMFFEFCCRRCAENGFFGALAKERKNMALVRFLFNHGAGGANRGEGRKFSPHRSTARHKINFF